MAQITITTTAEEQHKILETLIKLQGQTVPVSKIARDAKLNPNRVRYIIADLEDLGKIRRVPTRMFNEHYIRYKYEVLCS